MDYTSKETDQRELVGYPDPYDPSEPMIYYRIGASTYSYRYGEDTWRKGELLTERKLSYLRKKARQRAKRALRLINRSASYKARHEAYEKYKRENQKRFYAYRLDYLDKKFKSDQTADREYNVLVNRAIQALTVFETRVPSNRNQRIRSLAKRPSRVAIEKYIGFSRRQYKLRLRKQNAPWEWVAPEKFPKRQWDLDVLALFYKSESKLPKKKRSLRGSANFCNAYTAGSYEQWDTPLFVVQEGQPPVVMSFRDHWHRQMYYGGGDCFFQYPQIKWEANDELKLLNKLGHKWRKAELNAGNFLGESHKTWRMMQVIVENLSIFVKNLLYKGFISTVTEGGTFRSVKGLFMSGSFTKEIANAWLTYSFGMAPLVSDITALAEGLASYEVEDKTPYRVRASHSKIIVYKDYPIILRRNSLEDLSDVTPLMFASCEVKITKRYIAELKNTYTETPWTDFLNKWMLRDVMDVLWEVSPFSWFVDYFLHIQQALQASCVVRDMPIDKLMASEKTVTLGYTTYFASEAKCSWVSPCPTGLKTKEFTRYRVYDVTVPKPELISFSEAMSPLHLLNSIAVLITLSSKAKTLDRVFSSKIGKDTSRKLISFLNDAVRKSYKKP